MNAHCVGLHAAGKSSGQRWFCPEPYPVLPAYDYPPFFARLSTYKKGQDLFDALKEEEKAIAKDVGPANTGVCALARALALCVHACACMRSVCERVSGMQPLALVCACMLLWALLYLTPGFPFLMRALADEGAFFFWTLTPNELASLATDDEAGDKTGDAVEHSAGSASNPPTHYAALPVSVPALGVAGGLSASEDVFALITGV